MIRVDTGEFIFQIDAYNCKGPMHVSPEFILAGKEKSWHSLTDMMSSEIAESPQPNGQIIRKQISGEKLFASAKTVLAVYGDDDFTVEVADLSDGKRYEVIEEEEAVEGICFRSMVV